MTSPTASSGSASRREQRRHELANSSLRDGLRPSKPTGAGVIVGGWLIALWVIALVNAVLDHRLLRFGIKPRKVDGLPGLVLSPLLHADIGQLAASTLPFLVLGWLVLVSSARLFTLVTASVWLASDLVDWGLGPDGSVLVGVNGIVFGWFGYLVARAWYARQIKFIAVAVLVLVIFSSLLGGLLPRLGSHVFWAGQLTGLLAGVGIAALVHRKRRDGTARRRAAS